jgi:hypothetical protein
MTDYYVVVSDNDQPITIGGKLHVDDGGALVFEQYLANADLESIKKRAEYLSQRYGKYRIAKLVFIDEGAK